MTISIPAIAKDLRATKGFRRLAIAFAFGAIGSLAWSALAPRIGYVRTLAISLACGLPLMLAYLLLAPRTARAAGLSILSWPRKYPTLCGRRWPHMGAHYCTS